MTRVFCNVFFFSILNCAFPHHATIKAERPMLEAGLIIDNGPINESLHRFIQNGLSGTDWRITNIFVRSPTPSRHLTARLLWKAICKIDTIPLHFSRSLRPYGKKHSLKEYAVAISLPKHNEPLSERIRKSPSVPDVLLWVADGDPEPALAETCRLGLLAASSWDHDPGGAPGFQEILQKKDSIDITILHRQNAVSTERILFSGRIPTAPFFSFNRAAIRAKTFAFLQKALAIIAEPGYSTQHHPEKDPAKSFRRIPGITEQLHYLSACYMPAMARLFLIKTPARKVFSMVPHWHVAFQFSKNWKDAPLHGSSTIKNPVHHYLADPVVWSEDGWNVCFVEDFSYTTMKGCITAYELQGQNATPLGTVLQEPFHLSFPFIFEWEGCAYMCPDTNASGELRIYRCERFPMKWTHHKTIMSGVSCADSMLTPYGGKWWLLTNMDSSDLGEHCSELHLFHADRPDSEEWTAHPQNPVVFDSEKARNGGLIIENGKLYRVFQHQGFDQYGKSMGVAEITAMDECRYEERTVTEIAADFFPNCRGTHTLSFRNGMMAVDLLRHEKLTI